jgi:glutamate/tyrosine decarboxylase-like PLP-dependent enzyme
LRISSNFRKKIENSHEFNLLAPVRLNVVCFTLSGNEISSDAIAKFLAALCDRGKIFLTPTVYQGIPAMRAALVNWRTERKDIEIAWESLLETRNLCRVLQRFVKNAAISSENSIP